MVGHQHPAAHRHAVRSAMDFQQRAIGGVIRLAKERLLATVAALGDVVRDAGNYIASEPGHGVVELLNLSFDEILTGQPTVRLPGKRGPASRLEQQLDAIALLPRAEQRAVSTVLTAVLAQHGAQEAATA